MFQNTGLDLGTGIVRYKVSAICLLSYKLLDDLEFFSPAKITLDNREVKVII